LVEQLDSESVAVLAVESAHPLVCGLAQVLACALGLWMAPALVRLWASRLEIWSGVLLGKGLSDGGWAPVSVFLSGGPSDDE
jgi:hypothetical protein